MSFHVLALEEAVGTTANTDLDAISDDIVNVQNSHFFPAMPLDLIAAFVCGATINRGRIVTPKFRQYTLPIISPANLGAAPIADPPHVNYYANPLRLNPLEEIAVEITSDIAMGTEQSYALLFVADRRTPPPLGDVYTLRGTSTTAAVANTWTTAAVTWADSLPNGTYAIVGMELIGTAGIAGRLILSGQVMRPGCIAQVLATNKGASLFRMGAAGEWGRFRNTDMPRLQVLCSTTTAAWTVNLDVVPVAA